MSASTSDLFQKLGGASALVNTPRVTGVRAPAGATLTVDNCNWDQTTGKFFATYQVNTSGAVVAGTEIIWKGIVTSTTSIGTLTRVAGATDTGNAIGDYVELLPSSGWGNALVTGLLVQHNQDGTHGAVTATSLVASAGVTGATVSSTGDLQIRSTSLETIASERMFDYVASGCVITGTGLGSTLGWSMTSGVVYIGGKRLTVASTSGTVTASKDTYFDLLDPGSGTVATLVNTSGNIVNNNSASPALAASSVRIGIVVSGAGSIAAAASINQGQEDRVLPIASSIPYAVTDSLGNLICPRDPNRKILGYRQVLSSYTIASSTPAQVVGLSCPVIVPTGRKVKITGYCAAVTNSGAGNGSTLYVYDGATQLNQFNTTWHAGVFGFGMYPEAIQTPVTNSKTYNLFNAAQAGTSTFACGATFPSYIKVELA